MKHRRHPLVALIAAVALVMGACGEDGSTSTSSTFLSQPSTTPMATAVPASLRVAAPGVPFTMEVGDIVGLGSGATTVRFVEVVEDSRCPEGETCVWEGAVTVAVEWERGGTTGTAVLRGIASSEGPYFGDSPQAGLPGGATITLLGLDGPDGIFVITVVWDETTT